MGDDYDSPDLDDLIGAYEEERNIIDNLDYNYDDGYVDNDTSIRMIQQQPPDEGDYNEGEGTNPSRNDHGSNPLSLNTGSNDDHQGGPIQTIDMNDAPGEGTYSTEEMVNEEMDMDTILNGLVPSSLTTNHSVSSSSTARPVSTLASVPILPPALSIDAQTNRMAMNLSASYSAYLKSNGKIYRSNSSSSTNNGTNGSNHHTGLGWGRKKLSSNETVAPYLRHRPGASEYGDLPITIDGNMYFLPYTASPTSTVTVPSSAKAKDKEISSTTTKSTASSHETSVEFRNLLETVHMNIASKRIDAVARARALLADDEHTPILPPLSSSTNSFTKISMDDDLIEPKFDNNNNPPDDDESFDKIVGSQVSDNGDLWVSKYAPRLFVDLLSPDSINREVLKWIKQWDNIVFGNSNKSNGSNEADIASSTIVPFAGVKGSRPSPGTKGNQASTTGKPTSRPYSNNTSSSSSNKYYFKSKVLLICGPPGTGKTTLAHIAAHQAGYRTAEVNASDDRTGKSIRDMINAAQTMRSVFGDKRPVCVVLDEIDGMEGGPTGGVAELVKMIKATNKAAAIAARAKYNTSTNGDDTNDNPAKGKDDDDNDDFADDGTANNADNGKENTTTKRLSGKKRNRTTANGDNDNTNDDNTNEGTSSTSTKTDASLILTRPLICICNDVYASVLRELRPLVQIVELGPPSSDRLRERIQLICRNEGLSITPDAASTLVRLTDADIRSCLNTLQFIKAQNSLQQQSSSSATKHTDTITTVTRVRITSEKIERAAVSSKDETKALLDVWSTVYSAQLARSGTPSPSLRYLDLGNTPQTPMNIIWQQTTAYAADSRLLLSGLEENLLRVHTSDPTLQRTVQALDWLCYGEEIGHKVSSTQMYTLSKYLPAATAGIHLHRASDIRVRMQWPRTDALMRSKHEHHRNIVEAFMHGRATAPGSIIGAGSLDQRSTILDMLSPLVTITNPPLRAIGNLSLMNAVEQKDVANLVQILCTNGLDYTPPSIQNRYGSTYTNANDLGRSSILQPAIDQVLSYDHSLPFDGQIRTNPLPEVLRDLITHQLRFARVRYSRSSRETNGNETGSNPNPNGSNQTASTTGSHPPVELPEHVKKQLMATGTSAASHTASTSTLSSSDILMNDGKTMENGTTTTRNFLAEAASKSRGAELARKRLQVLDQQQQASSDNSINGSHGSNSTASANGNGTAGYAHGSSTNSTTVYPVVYKYQEGFTNAVKRTLKLQDFL